MRIGTSLNQEDRETLDMLEDVVRQGGMLTDLIHRLPLWSKLHGVPGLGRSSKA